MAGFAQIPAGAKGTCDNIFSFSQTPLDRVKTSIDLPGNWDKNFDLTSKTGIMSWSPCGGSTAILNMNTQCSINPTTKQALIAVRSIPLLFPRTTFITALSLVLPCFYSGPRLTHVTLRSTMSAAFSRSSSPSSGVFAPSKCWA
jgi:hypothetical protein